MFGIKTDEFRGRPGHGLVAVCHSRDGMADGHVLVDIYDFLLGVEFEECGIAMAGRCAKLGIGDNLLGQGVMDEREGGFECGALFLRASEEAVGATLIDSIVVPGLSECLLGVREDSEELAEKE